MFSRVAGSDPFQIDPDPGLDLVKGAGLTFPDIDYIRIQIGFIIWFRLGLYLGIEIKLKCVLSGVK